jgi:alkylation response protein AidB-like acyl-CoA dehydrogenase
MGDAVMARRVMCLVGSGAPNPGERGLSMVLVDVQTPGVSVRSVASVGGDNPQFEAFFGDVVVPASALIGADGQGWAVVTDLTHHQRAMRSCAPPAIDIGRDHA